MLFVLQFEGYICAVVFDRIDFYKENIYKTGIWH